MTRYSKNIWAQEMGINLDDLLRERPEHLEQLQNTRAIARRGAEYWEAQRRMAEYGSGKISEAGPDWFPNGSNGYQWMTVKQIAKHLWIGESTVYSWIKRGLLPAKIPQEKGIRISCAELDILFKPIKPKPPQKSPKVNKYEFTHFQYEIARMSLNAKGSV